MIAPDQHAAVVEALEANQWELLRAIGAGGGAEFHEDDDIFWIVTGVPAAAFNGVVRTQVAPERADETIRTVAATLDGRGSPWAWFTGPSALPVDLADRLVAAGFTLIADMPGMAAPLDDVPVPHEALRYEQVREEPSLEAFGILLGVAFEMPPEVVEPFLRALDVAGSGNDPVLRNFIAFDGGEPVACGSLVIAAGVAGLYNIGVTPERQGQGVGRAMTAALMAEGAAAGARTAILTSTPDGLACYRGLGFEARCQMRLYAKG